MAVTLYMMNLHSILCKVNANSNKSFLPFEPHSSFRFQYRLLTMTTFFVIVVCTENLLSDPRLLYKNIRFVKNRRNWPINFRQKLLYFPFQDVSKKSKRFLQKHRIFPRVTEKRYSRHPLPPPPHTHTPPPPPPPPKRTIDISCG